MWKLLFTSILLILLADCILPSALGEDLSWKNFLKQSSLSYYSVCESYELPVYQGEDIVFALDGHVSPGEQYDFPIDVPQDGQYEMWFSYRNTTQAVLPTEMVLQIDGQIRFSEMNSIQLRSLWMDDGAFPEDRYGNQRACETYSANVIQETGVCDSSFRLLAPMLFELTAGEHRITLLTQDGEADLLQFSLRSPQTLSPYSAGNADGDRLIVLEGEKIYSRSRSDIRAGGEFNAALTPSVSDRILMNHLEGGSFNQAGDVVTYQFSAEESGWYCFGANYRQNSREDFPVFIDLLIDGSMPSEACRAVVFDYTESFQLMTAKTQDEPLTLWLEKGEHTLSLRINADCLLPVYRLIQRMTSEINALYQEIIYLTGGTTMDKYRNYNIRANIPELQATLNQWADECDEMLKYVGGITDKTTAFSYLQLCSAQLRSLAEKPEDVPRRVTELATGSSSVAKYLSQLLQDISNHAIEIDRIFLYQNQAVLPKSSGLSGSLTLQSERFFRSFSQQAYSSSRREEGHLQVWMAESRALVELLQSLIDSDFTQKTGIVVDLSIMANESKLVLSNAAGTAPDVALSMSSVMPSYLDIRGALYDLTQFEDFGSVASRFKSNLFLPYIHETGVYALPQQINVWLLFYRTDILDSLGLPVPDTVEDIKKMIPELQARSMNFYYPTAGMGGVKYFAGTLPMIYQTGGAIYGKLVGRTELEKEDALNGFKELTDLFTIYSLPIDSGAGFYQRFRDGTLPIGISDLGTYILLKNAAPEIDGLWDIAVIPGIEGDNGEISRYINGNTRAMGILASTDMPKEAWEFLKWWSSDEIQRTYGNLLYTVYGEDIMWVSANYKALFQLPIKRSDMNVIREQVEWIKDPPWCLGTYMVERELSNAFLSVTVDSVDARRALDKAVKAINRETYRKLEEFGYYRNGELIRDYLAPDAALIEAIVENYQHGTEGGDGS